MRYLETVAVGLVLAFAQAVAWAQIYESTDEQGNPVFSDEPVNGDSSMVDLTETNIADAPAPEPAESASPGTRAKDEAAGKASGRPAYQDTDEILEKRRREEEFERVKASSTPHEVLDAEPRHEVMDAEPRREVGDFDQAPVLDD